VFDGTPAGRHQHVVYRKPGVAERVSGVCAVVLLYATSTFLAFNAIYVYPGPFATTFGSNPGSGYQTWDLFGIECRSCQPMPDSPSTWSFTLIVFVIFAAVFAFVARRLVWLLIVGSFALRWGTGNLGSWWLVSVIIAVGATFAIVYLREVNQRLGNSRLDEDFARTFGREGLPEDRADTR